MKSFKVGILGATGAVGQEMQKILVERDFPVSELHLLASKHSAGKVVKFKDQDIVVEEACAEAFKGLDIVLGAAENDIAERFVDDIKAAGNEAMYVIVDTSKLEDLQKLVDATMEAYGTIDILVNNAGVSESTPFVDYTEEMFSKVMDLNVKGIFNATRAACECMIARGDGVILNTSSMVSIYGQPSGIAYPASKFAVNGLTVSLARELGPKGIRVNAVAPGITETDMMKAVPKEMIEPLIAQIPLRRLGQPEDIANAFVFLASEEASYITGVVLSVDGMART